MDTEMMDASCLDAGWPMVLLLATSSLTFSRVHTCITDLQCWLISIQFMDYYRIPYCGLHT